MKNAVQVLILFLFLVITPRANAQLIVMQSDSNTFTPQELLTNVFMGSGITVTDIQFKGNPIQVGYFSNALDNVGLNRGLLMTTGKAMDAAGFQSDGPSTEINLPNLNDPDLFAIGQEIQPGAAIKDPAIFEISFIPASDTLRFRYVFSSEEYPEYVCTQFNDVFGFFIWGPGISGSFSNNSQNIALVPDPNDPTGLTFTMNPVAISTVNAGNPGDSNCTPSYPMHYNDNTGNLHLAYDGYTNVFTALAVVQPCQEYHIKLAIADLGDAILDSGVFLEASSFGSQSVVADLQTTSMDGTISEGGAGAVINFGITFSQDVDLPLNYSIFGSATHPDDYTITHDGEVFTPGDPLIIPAGELSTSLHITAIDDGAPENNEAVKIIAQSNVCYPDTIIIPIVDLVLVPPNLGPDTTINVSGNMTMQLNGDVGIQTPSAQTFTYTGDDIISKDLPKVVAPIQVTSVPYPTLTAGSIQSVCVKLDHQFDSELDLFLLSPNHTPLLLSANHGTNSRNMDVCFTPVADPVSLIDTTLKELFPPDGIVDASNLNNLYFKGDFAPEESFKNLWNGAASSPTNGTWKLIIFDDNGDLFGDPNVGKLKEWSITFEPTYYIDYQWDYTTDLSCLDCPNPILTIPSETTTYTLTVSDTYGNSFTDEFAVSPIVGLPSQFVDKEVELFPNPTNNQLNIHFTAQQKGKAQLVIYNSLGQEVLRQNHIIQGESDLTIDVQDLTTGHYWVNIIGVGGEYFGRFFVF